MKIYENKKHFLLKKNTLPKESIIRSGHKSLIVSTPATFKLIKDTVVLVQ